MKLCPSLAMPTIKFTKENKTVEVATGTNLRRAAINAGIQLYTGPHKVVNCQGFGQCGSCRVHVTKGKENLSPQGLFERLRLILGPLTFFYRLGNEDKLRLACQARVNGDVEIETTPSMNWHGERYWG